MKKLLLLLIIPILSFGQDCISYCNDPNACNYNPDTTYTWSCIYAAEYYDCDGFCLNDEDTDGICDEFEPTEILGCMDENACNYNENATQENNLCEYINDPCGGSFGTYNVSAEGVIWLELVHTGIWGLNCECININGCEDPEACNYFDLNIISGPDCIYPGESSESVHIPSLTAPGGVEVTDACQEISQECECCYRERVGYFYIEIYDGNPLYLPCEEYICGCMDENACNYDPDALLSNNTCVYDDGCTNIQEIFDSKKLLNAIDLLGRNTNNKGFQLLIYDDGSVEKKYVIE